MAKKKEVTPPPVQAPVQVFDTVGVLSVIVDATLTAGHTFAPMSVIEQLPPTTIQYNNEVRNAENQVAVKATDEGIKYVQTVRAERAAQVAPAQAAGWGVGQPLPNGAAMPQFTPMPASSAAPTLAAQDAAIPLKKYEFGLETVLEIPKPNAPFQGTRYPFALLGIAPAPNAFFVPATPENINPKKRLQSSVNAANQANKACGKKFIVRDATLPDGTQGARVFRIA